MWSAAVQGELMAFLSQPDTGVWLSPGVQDNMESVDG